ncbi:hypothetical protein BDU57DRAFT_516639 [Ampelomyces quisqualis]|uniref:Uncharacterized protein n=1 Tax=Ampelomyces quisqualis TaxID=50730 RepID=A0A6A5QNP8_AMPQU|nr:hypothetical protein BDU57DRAFT_516639 [Ampelomyces quisqualis]
MPQFKEDSMSATPATIQARRAHPNTLTVFVAARLRFPVASPSPLYPGMNEALNTEAFPDFVDLLSPGEAGTLHCIEHCSEDICRRMIASGHSVPPCRCGAEIVQEEQPVISPESIGPEINLTDGIFDTIVDISPVTEMVKINRDDAHKLVAQFEPLVVLRALDDLEFMGEIRASQLGEPNRVATEVIMTAFDLISLYFRRTMKNDAIRTVKPGDLRVELKVYLSTGLVEWIQDHCTQWEQDEIFDEMEDVRFIFEAARMDLAGAVSDLWIECLEDIVGLFVWRDAEVRRYELGQTNARHQPYLYAVPGNVWLNSE